MRKGFPAETFSRLNVLAPQIDGKNLVDIGFVGEVTSLELTGVSEAIDREVVPVISPIAQTEEGMILNVNADVAAGAMAGALKQRR